MMQRIPSRQDQYSQELRLASQATDRCSYVGGLYFFTQKINGHADQHLWTGRRVLAAQPGELHGADPAQPAGWLRPVRQLALQDEQLRRVRRGRTTQFTDRLTATLGLRYTYEDKEGTLRHAGLRRSWTSPTCRRRRRRNCNSAKLSIFRPQSYTAEDDGGSLSGRANLA